MYDTFVISQFVDTTAHTNRLMEMLHPTTFPDFRTILRDSINPTRGVGPCFDLMKIMGRLENPALAMMAVMKRTQYRRVQDTAFKSFHSVVKFPARSGVVGRRLVDSKLLRPYNSFNPDVGYQVVLDLDVFAERVPNHLKKYFTPELLYALQLANQVVEVPARITYVDGRLREVFPDFGKNSDEYIKVKGLGSLPKILAQFKDPFAI